MTGRSFNFIAVIVIVTLTVWTPLIPDIYSEIASNSSEAISDSSVIKPSVADTLSARDGIRSDSLRADTTKQRPKISALIGKKATFWLKLVGAVMIVVLTIYAHYVKDYRPFLGYEELRKETLDHILKPLQALMTKEGLDDLRFTVMQRRRWIRLTRFVQLGRLIPIYHLGDLHTERDKGLSYWYLKLFCIELKQGTTGHAFLKEEDIFGDMIAWRFDQSIQIAPSSTPAQSGSTAPNPVSSGSSPAAASAQPGSAASNPTSSGPSPAAVPAQPGSTASSPISRGLFGWLHDKRRLGLTNYRISLLSDLTMIVSIYMISWRGRRYRCTGVINIASTNAQTAYMMFNHPKSDQTKKALRRYLNESAQFLSRWL